MNGNDAAEESDEHDSKSAPFYAKDDNVGQRRELRIFHAPKKRDLTSVFRPLSVRWDAFWRPQTPIFTSPVRETSSQMWHVPHFVKQILGKKMTRLSRRNYHGFCPRQFGKIFRINRVHATDPADGFYDVVGLYKAGFHMRYRPAADMRRFL